MNFRFNGIGTTSGTKCNLLDASAYSGGIQFDISGNPGPSGTLGAGIDYLNSSGTKVSTRYTITNVTSSVQTVKIPWASFAGGTIDTSKISGINFFFIW